MKPTVGRIVHFIDRTGAKTAHGDPGPHAAIVTRVHSDTCVDLCVFGPQPVVVTSVVMDDSGASYAWMWPPRAD